MAVMRTIQGVPVTSGDTSTAKIGAPTLSPPPFIITTQRPPVLTP